MATFTIDIKSDTTDDNLLALFTGWKEFVTDPASLAAIEALIEAGTPPENLVPDTMLNPITAEMHVQEYLTNLVIGKYMEAGESQIKKDKLAEADSDINAYELSLKAKISKK